MKKRIYHGSKDIIKKPKYGVGKPYNDYGLGFYCTESLDLAKEWSVDDNRDGYTNIYQLDMKDMKRCVQRLIGSLPRHVIIFQHG